MAGSTARAPRLAFTGRAGQLALPRRTLLRASGLAPLLALLPRREASAAEYSSAAEALDAVDRLEADVAVRLRALSDELPPVRPFVGSVLADQERQRGERARVRRRLGLPPAASQQPTAPPERDLASLRKAQEALVYAHAEGLPALDDSWSVRILARHIVELARHLTVIDLWIEAEEQRG